MARRWLRLVTLVALVAASGCAAPAEPEPNAPDGAAVLTWEGCDNLSTTLAVPRAAAEGWLPEGFATVDADATGETVVAYALILTCDAVVVDGTRQEGTTHAAYVELAVVPPADDRVEGVADDHALSVYFTATHRDVAAAAARWGLGDGSVGDITWSPTPTGARASAAAAEGGFTIEAAVAPGGGGAALAAGTFGLYVADAVGTVRAFAGAYADAGFERAAVTLTGDAPLVDRARPAGTGGLVRDYNLTWAVATAAGQV